MKALTKDMEREALKKIEAIIAELGAGSYIGVAFEGVCEVARENIENDWACSMMQRAEGAERAAESLQKKLNEANATIDSLVHENVSLSGDRDTVKFEKDALREAIEAMNTELIETREQLRIARADGEEMDNQIIHLKAQLYDYMTM